MHAEGGTTPDPLVPASIHYILLRGGTMASLLCVIPGAPTGLHKPTTQISALKTQYSLIKERLTHFLKLMIILDCASLQPWEQFPNGQKPTMTGISNL